MLIVCSFFQENTLNQGLTYFGHTFGCTVANKCLDIYQKDNNKIINDVKEKGITLNTIGKTLKEESSIIKDYRSNGLLGGFELNLESSKMNEIKNKLYNNGIYCYVRNNFIFTAPPLIISNELIVETMLKINKIIHD